MKKNLDLSPALIRVMQRLRKQIREEFADQGHRLTGAAEASIDFDIEKNGDKYTATMDANDYVLYLEFGVKAERIPYTEGSGAKTSKYIEGLISFFRKRGLPQREAKGAAFATARKHKREGMPTRASAAYSRNGQRTGFVRTVLTDNLEEIGKIIEEMAGHELRLILADTFEIMTLRVPI